MQVGLVNDRIFLVNASLGLYPQLLEEREEFKRRYGRYRATAVVSGLVTLLREHQQLELEIDHDGEREWVRTPTVFVGNNALQLEATGLEEAKDVERHKLAGVVPRPVSTAALFRLALRGALGTLGSAEQVRHFPFRRMTVQPGGKRARRRIKVATDGELQTLSFPIEFAVSPKPLLLLVPDDHGPAP
jgi:diacylglycerol kinase family enzyme